MSGAVGGAFDLEAYLAAERRAIEEARARLTGMLLADAPVSLAEPIRYALDAGGKRLRPVLCVAAYRAALATPDAATRRGGAASAIYDMACGIEFIHTYSLIHDDLPCMDDDDLRRGRPTTHRVFGEARAVLAGAALIPLACLAVERGGAALGLDAEERMTLVGELCRAAGASGMVGGQVLDLEAEGRRISLEELERVHQHKTGALLAASLRLGGLAARAGGEVLEALDAYGRALGLAFQIADDVLDLTGSTAALGKTAGRDLDLAKATYPALLGVERARSRARAEADRAIEALGRAGLASRELESLAHYTVERDR